MKNQVRSVYITTILFMTILIIIGTSGGTAMSATAATAKASPTQAVVSLPAPPVTLNNQLLQFEVPPIIENNRVLVPLRAVFEAMGATVKWNQETRTATATRGSTTVVLPLNSTQPTVNGAVQTLDVPARIVNQRTLAPLRFVGEAFGGYVAWDEVSRAITMQSPFTDGAKAVAVTVNAEVVNLRSGPARSFGAVDSASSGERLDFLGEQNGWYQISRNGKNAWVAGWLANVVWQDEAPVVTVPTDPVPQDGLSISSERDNSGLRMIMESGVKLETKITPSNGKITYEFANRQIEGSGYVQQQFGSELIKAQASNQGKNVMAEIQFPAGVEYRTTTENDGKREVLTIPDFITGVGRSTFGSSGEKIVISSTVALAYTSSQTATSLEVVFTNVLPGKALTDYKYNSSLISSLGFKTKTVGSVSQTVLTLVTSKPAKFSVGSSSDGASLNILLIDQSESQSRIPMVVLDAGHGGKDTGARGDNLDEKDVNLDVALKVGQCLAQKGIKYVYTRNNDTYLNLSEIPAIANLYNAALFVSIHSNSNTSPDPSGTETYYYAPLTTPELYIQKDERCSLATHLQQSLVAKLGRNDRGVKQANFAVLRETSMPSALIEMAFISNPTECELLKQQNFRQMTAQAIADGIEAYMKENIKS